MTSLAGAVRLIVQRWSRLGVLWACGVVMLGASAPAPAAPGSDSAARTHASSGPAERSAARVQRSERSARKEAAATRSTVRRDAASSSAGRTAARGTPASRPQTATDGRRASAAGVGSRRASRDAPRGSAALARPSATARAATEPARQAARAARRPAAVALAATGVAAPAAALAASPRPDPEARLIGVFRLIGQERLDDALRQAESLVRDHPNFPLAQLTYADLLMARSGALRSFGSAPLAQLPAQAERLQQLREEARRRLAALRERPPAGAIPRQFIMLPPTSRHAIAVDASRSRVYLFENGESGLRLVADYYASLGKLGTDKRAEGDQRTPLGVYFVTSRLDARQLSDFYGSGALPLNYPNEYDRRQGRTGSGIWLHGVPSDSYARSPHSTDGCVALANPDLADILARVQPRSTPVLIAPQLEWVQPAQLEAERQRVRNLLEGWRVARSTGDLQRALSFYSSQFSAGNATRAQLAQGLEREVATLRGRATHLKDLSVLTWHDGSDIMVVTFGEVLEGQRTGPIKRQYWGKEGGLWKIFYEGVIG